MIEQRIRARVGAYSVPAVVHAVQGDTGRVFVFELEDYAITGAEGASLNCQRPDKSFYTYAGTVSAEDNTVTVALDVEDGALTQEGVVTFQLELTEAGLIVCTFRGSIIVEPVVGGEATQEEKDFRDAIQAQLNAKVSNEELQEAVDDLEDEITDTASGLQTQINAKANASDVALKANKATTINGKDLSEDRILYVQDIPSKNLLPNTASTQTINGVTFTVNADGTVSTSGTASANVEFFIYANGYWSPSPYTFDKSKQYILSGCPTGGADSTYSIRIYEYSGSSSTGNYKDYGSGVTFTPNSSGTGCLVMIAIQSGTNMNGKTFRPMIRLASIEDDSYVPYSKTNVELTKIEEGTIALASGWVVNDDTFAQLYKSNRLVTFNLCAYPTSKNLSIGWNTVGTMPQGFRPSGTITFNASIYGSGNLFLKTERVQLKADGVLQIYSQTARSGDVIRVLIFGSYISA